MLAASKQPPNKQPSKRGHYVKLTGVQQAQIARYTLFHGNQAVIRRYNEEYSVKYTEVEVCGRTCKAGDFRFEEKRPSTTFR